MIHKIFDILRKSTQETFPPGWEWQALDQEAFDAFLHEHDEARNLDENDVAYIAFNAEGNGYFNIIIHDEHIIPTFLDIFGQHPHEWVALNEAQFSEYPHCETFATQFAVALDVQTRRQTLNNGYVKIIFCHENINMDFLRQIVDVANPDIVRYGVDEHHIITQNAGSIKYHNYFEDSNGPRWVASGPQHIVVVWNEGEDELTINVQVRNTRLLNLVTFVFVMYGCSILSESSSSDPQSWTVFKIPYVELKELPRTRRLRKRHQRRQFLNLFPFLLCDEASQTLDRYIDTIPVFRPESFADAIVTRRYDNNA